MMLDAILRKSVTTGDAEGKTSPMAAIKSKKTTTLVTSVKIKSPAAVAKSKKNTTDRSSSEKGIHAWCISWVILFNPLARSKSVVGLLGSQIPGFHFS